jgi:hypothetical protein
MEIIDFNKEHCKKYMSFSMLEDIIDDNTDIHIKVSVIDQKIDSPIDSIVMRLPDGRLMLAFQGTYPNMSYNNLEVSNASSSQIVNLQVFERMRRYYDKDGRIDGKTHFFFYNSMPVTNEFDDGTFNVDARCHYGLLGPETFMKDDAPVIPLVDYNHVYVYEPIFSVNGTAHFGIAQTNTDIEWYSNADPFPRITFTVQEGLKQIIEWAAVNSEPFANNETISSKAAQFLSLLNFSDTEIEHIQSTQPDMQIYKYLKGDINARTRPENPGPLTENIINIIQKRVSHCSFLNFCRTHNIDLDNDTIQEIVEFQLSNVETTKQRLLGSLNLDSLQMDDSNIDKLKSKLFKGRLIDQAVLLETINSIEQLTNSLI